MTEDPTDAELDPDADADEVADDDQDVDIDAAADDTDFDDSDEISDDDPDAAIDLRAADVQCSAREAEIRRAIEERREARRLKADLSDLDLDFD